MIYQFDPAERLILIKAEATGPKRTMPLRLILDTGATTSVFRESILAAMGYDLANVTDRVEMTTGSHVTTVSRVVLTRFSALGKHRFGMQVVSHSLPLNISASGLLGLDFLRDFSLSIDFRNGQITLD